jgi:hypothetical protein
MAERQILEGVNKERLLWFLTAINGGNSSSSLRPAPIPPVTDSRILMETSDFILTETSDFILTEVQ